MPRKAKPKAETESSASTPTWLKILVQVGDSFATLVSALSWPGLAILMVFFLIVQYGSLEQKREIIDLYVLGKGVNQQWALIAGGVFLFMVAFAQYWYYKKQRDKFWAELKRVGSEKSRLQEKISGKRLQHVAEKKQEGD